MAYTLHEGRIQEARWVPSPNRSLRPPDCEPELLVIHNISLPPGCFGGDCIERFFCNRLDCSEHSFFEQLRGVKVSAHLLIRRDGEVVQFVSFNDRAWHAGQSCYQGRDNCNDYSIGIELEGTDEAPYTQAQYDVLSALTVALIEHYPGMAPEQVVGHSEIAPGRKTDPGPVFDWPRYRRQLAAKERQA